MGNRIQSLMKFKKNTAGSWKIQKDTASVKSLNPIFSVIKSKTQRKLMFFTKKIHQQYDIPEGHCQCQVSEPLFLCDKVQNTEIFFLHSFIKEIPEGNCQSSEPHFLCDEIKRKNIFFFHRPVSSKMRFQKETTSAKSLNLIICAQMLLNTSTFFHKDNGVWRLGTSSVH